MIKPRIVFVSDVENKDVIELPVQMPTWASGFSLTQKQKNIETLHKAFNETTI